MKPPPTSIDLEKLPPKSLLVLEEVASIYRLAPKTVRMGVQRRTFSPAPWAKYPYRWRLEDIQADLKKRRETVYKPHGYATKRKK